jgi:alanine dehydrogenase
VHLLGAGQFQTGCVVAPLLGAQRPAHVAVVEEAFVQTHQADLAVGGSAVVAVVAAHACLEGGCVSLQDNFVKIV